MAGGTLVISRTKQLFPFFKMFLEKVGFSNVMVTGEEKDSLNFVISEVKPTLLLIESTFYQCGTPYMTGRLLKLFPKLNCAIVSISEYPDDLAAWFIWYGVRSYINFREGYDEFLNGLQEVKNGKNYIAPQVKNLIEEYHEWPRNNTNVPKREMEIFLMLCNGFDAKNIGKNLYITQRTVQWHINELYRIFHAHNKEELMKTALCLDIFNKDDLNFYGKPNPVKKLPDSAVLKQTINKRRA
jgi:DNA-binding NarL/FixJ family response regulator